MIFLEYNVRYIIAFSVDLSLSGMFDISYAVSTIIIDFTGYYGTPRSQAPSRDQPSIINVTEEYWEGRNKINKGSTYQQSTISSITILGKATGSLIVINQTKKIVTFCRLVGQCPHGDNGLLVLLLSSERLISNSIFSLLWSR